MMPFLFWQFDIVGAQFATQFIATLIHAQVALLAKLCQLLLLFAICYCWHNLSGLAQLLTIFAQPYYCHAQNGMAGTDFCPFILTGTGCSVVHEYTIVTRLPKTFPHSRERMAGHPVTFISSFVWAAAAATDDDTSSYSSSFRLRLSPHLCQHSNP
jgi:hypothetical protein